MPKLDGEDPVRVTRKLLLPLFALFMPWTSHAQDAASYPSRPIRVIVPQPPGGGVDVSARIASEAVEKHLGQRLIIENKPGAGGRIGTAAAARATPDGYNLLFTPKTPITIFQHMKLKLEFDPERDFTPVAIVIRQPGLLITRPSLPAKTLVEFIALAKDNPGKLTFGIQGLGSEFHVAMEILNRAADIELRAIPYQGGSPAIVDLLADRLDAMFLVPAAIREHLANRRLNALATLNARRLVDFPDVPAMAEIGLAEVTSSSWFGYMAPSGTPPVFVEKFVEALRRLPSDAALAKRITDIGGELDVAGPAEFAAIIEAERRQYGKIVVESNIEGSN